MRSSTLELAVVGHEPGTPIGTLGTCAYGDWDQVIRSYDERLTDRRWISEILVAYDQNCTEGMVTLHRSQVPELPDANLRQALEGLDAGGEDARKLIFIGGHSCLVGGMAVRGRGDLMVAERTLSELTAGALRRVGQQGAVPIALYVPHDQVPGMVGSWPGVSVHPGGVRSTFRLHGATNLDEFFQGRDREVRGTWRRDQRDFDALGLRAEPAELTPELIRQAAPLVAAVKVRNGAFDDHRLANLRLQRWLTGAGPRATGWTLRAEGELLGIALGELNQRRLSIHEVGLVASHPDRSAIYRAVGFHAPMMFALEAGLDEIEVGADHPVPKRVRGADQTLQWHLVGHQLI